MGNSYFMLACRSGRLRHSVHVLKLLVFVCVNEAVWSFAKKTVDNAPAAPDPAAERNGRCKHYQHCHLVSTFANLNKTLYHAIFRHYNIVHSPFLRRRMSDLTRQVGVCVCIRLGVCAYLPSVKRL